jgi:hypothetical protein
VIIIIASDTHDFRHGLQFHVTVKTSLHLVSIGLTTMQQKLLAKLSLPTEAFSLECDAQKPANPITSSHFISLDTPAQDKAALMVHSPVGGVWAQARPPSSETPSAWAASSLSPLPHLTTLQPCTNKFATTHSSTMQYCTAMHSKTSLHS